MNPSVPVVAVVGRPNVGKSSLFNALGGAASALVSPEEGTTRDYLVQHLEIDGVMIELVDTAGWRSVNGAVQKIEQPLRKYKEKVTDRHRAHSAREQGAVAGE